MFNSLRLSVEVFIEVLPEVLTDITADIISRTKLLIKLTSGTELKVQIKI